MTCGVHKNVVVLEQLFDSYLYNQYINNCIYDHIFKFIYLYNKYINNHLHDTFITRWV